MRRFQLRTSICRKSLVCAISVADAPNHDRKRERKREGEREYAVARSRTVSSRTFPSFSSFSAPFVSPAQPSSSLPLAVSPLSTSSLSEFAVPVHASLEDTRRSYAHTRIHTSCTSQISTLREHTNKPPSHVCTYSIRAALCMPSLPWCPALSRVSSVRLSPAFLFLCLTLFAFILSILTDSYHSLTLARAATSSARFLAP